MTYAIVIASKDHARNPWPQSLHKALYEMPQDGGVTTLNEGAWLVHLDSSLIFLARLVCLLHDEKLPYKVTFSEQKPAFIASAEY